MQNEAQSTGRKRLLLIGAAVLVLILIFGALILGRDKKASPNATINPAQTNDDGKTVVLKEWAVKFPSTKVGKYFTNLDTSSDITSFTVPSTGAKVEERYIIVRGFDTNENLCTLPFAASAIYRHKEENPGIDYSDSFSLNTVTVKKIKVGDWWYSTTSIITDGECFPSNKSESTDYLTLANQYFNDFSQMQQIKE